MWLNTKFIIYAMDIYNDMKITDSFVRNFFLESSRLVKAIHFKSIKHFFDKQRMRKNNL